MTITLPSGTEVLEDELKIWEAYNFQCVGCKAQGVTIHEDPPRSRNPRWREEPWNRFVICNKCHDMVHTLSRLDAQTYLHVSRGRNFPNAEETLRCLT